jgi:hypothetical protein
VRRGTCSPRTSAISAEVIPGRARTPSICDLLSARRADAGDIRKEILMSVPPRRPLPERPSLEQLRKQAREYLDMQPANRMLQPAELKSDQKRF